MTSCFCLSWSTFRTRRTLFPGKYLFKENREKVFRRLSIFNWLDWLNVDLQSFGRFPCNVWIELWSVFMQTSERRSSRGTLLHTAENYAELGPWDAEHLRCLLQQGPFICWIWPMHLGLTQVCGRRGRRLRELWWACDAATQGGQKYFWTLIYCSLCGVFGGRRAWCQSWGPCLWVHRGRTCGVFLVHCLLWIFLDAPRVLQQVLRKKEQTIEETLAIRKSSHELPQRPVSYQDDPSFETALDTLFEKKIDDGGTVGNDDQL